MPFPVDEKYIEQAESKLGAKFPAIFRLKLMRENGGNLSTHPDEWVLYPVMDTSSKKRLKRTFNDIVLETKNSRKWTGFPPDAVAIGDNMGGDKLVLIPSPESPGVLQPRLFWWDHETGEVYLISDDLRKNFE